MRQIGEILGRGRAKSSGPVRSLDIAYEQMLAQLHRVRLGMADAMVAERRLSERRTKLVGQVADLQIRARRSLQAADEQAARSAIEQALLLEIEINEITPQTELLGAQLRRLESGQQALASQVSRFRSKRDAMKGQLASAEASANAADMLAGLTQESSVAIDGIKQMQLELDQVRAHAAAIEELREIGALDSLNSESTERVDEQFEQLKRELEAGDS